jgi:hypothetical protein
VNRLPSASSTSRLYPPDPTENTIGGRSGSGEISIWKAGASI